MNGPKLVAAPVQVGQPHRLLADLPSEPRLNLLLEAVFDEKQDKAIRAMAAETLRAAYAKALSRLEACAAADEMRDAMLRTREVNRGR